jgi:hypothetical protein
LTALHNSLFFSYLAFSETKVIYTNKTKTIYISNLGCLPVALGFESPQPDLSPHNQGSSKVVVTLILESSPQ